MFDRRHLLGALASVLGLGASEALGAVKHKKKKTTTRKRKTTHRKTTHKKAVHHAPAPPPKPVIPDETAPSTKTALTAAFHTILNDLLTQSPTAATSFGMDKGDFAYQKARLDDRSAAGLAANVTRLQKAVVLLEGLDRNAMNLSDRVNYDTVLWDLQTQLEGAKGFPFGDNGTAINLVFYAPTPYVVSQLSGFGCVIPDFLNTQHTIANETDAQAYLSRLDAFAVALDQETDRLRQDAARGVTTPDFILKAAITQLSGLRDAQPETATLVTSLVARTASANIAGDWQTPAVAKVGGPIKAALDRQIGALNDLLAKARHEAGVRELPGGDDYYVWAAKSGTSTQTSPKDIHDLGLQKVSDINAELTARFRALGKTGAPGPLMHALYTDPAQLYPNTDDGKAQLIQDLNAKVDQVYARVPQYFGVVPKTKVTIRRVPPAIEAGQPGGYYQPAALDGSRPGIYYINLRDTAETPKFLLSTLTYHESVPGHHMQISIQQEVDMPQLRKIASFNAYVEGWALYAEQLAGEMGLYDNDPYGRIGYLHDALLRAVRLVVDTGTHHLGWSREQAIAYMQDQLGDAESACATEIERYCAWPGQALGYMVGKLTWLSIREAMKKKQGAAFDIKKFHDTGLTHGSMPLDVLEGLYDGLGLT
ncbi:MAG: DUF885 domain-containing protein [Asticcacaulis sp.]|uniref:DUF885 domain-containing protein n=1 Tax=Asticcacaulis sp. TaxID=1872648 RepID=UPI003F7C05E4